MRQIKFRGLIVDGEGWIYGYYSLEFERGYLSQGMDDVPPRCSYITNDNGCHEVHTESVGQFTGRQGKNGVNVYDGAKLKGGRLNQEVVVSWDVKCGRWLGSGEKYKILGHRFNRFEVIGSVHDNK